MYHTGKNDRIAIAAAAALVAICVLPPATADEPRGPAAKSTFEHGAWYQVGDDSGTSAHAIDVQVSSRRVRPATNHVAPGTMPANSEGPACQAPVAECKEWGKLPACQLFASWKLTPRDAASVRKATWEFGAANAPPTVLEGDAADQGHAPAAVPAQHLANAENQASSRRRVSNPTESATAVARAASSRRRVPGEFEPLPTTRENQDREASSRRTAGLHRLSRTPELQSPSELLAPAIAEGQISGRTSPARQLDVGRILESTQQAVAERGMAAADSIPQTSATPDEFQDPALLPAEDRGLPLAVSPSAAASLGSAPTAAPPNAAPTRDSTSPGSKPLASTTAMAQVVNLRLGAGTFHRLQLSDPVHRIEIADPRVCEVLRQADRRLDLLAKQNGQTTVTIHYAVPRASEVYAIRVGVQTVPQRESVSDQHLQNLITEMFPDCDVSLAADDGSLVVTGVARNDVDAVRIVSFVRSLRLIPVVDRLKVQR